MADRTQRWCWNNLLTQAGTLLAVSSEQAAFPRANLKDPQRTKTWRGLLGWNVGAGYNDKLDFFEDINARVAVLAAGNYATGDAMAAQVQSAMNGALGHVNTYTVTYDAATKAFTIARATGTAALALKFATGANLATAVHHDIGFSDTDLSGSTTYTGDKAAYKSREWVTFDLGSAAALRVGIAHYHNLGLLGTVRLKANSTNVWTAPPSSQVLAGDDLKRILFFGSLSYRYWRIEFDDAWFNTLGYTECGVPFGGDYLEPGRSVSQGYEEVREQLSTVAQGDTGSIYQDLKPERAVIRCSFPRLSRGDRDALKSMLSVVRVGAPLFFAIDPQNYPHQDTLYAYLPAPIGFMQSVGDGTPPDRFTVQFSVVEML